MKQLTPVRLVKNRFYDRIQEAELRGASREEINEILGSKRSKLGIFEGDLDEGELEIGQISAAVKKVQGAKDILLEVWEDFCALKKEMCAQV